MSDSGRNQREISYSNTIPRPATTAVTAYNPNSIDPTPTIILFAPGTPAPDELEELADAASAVPVGFDVTVPVPAVPASFINELHVPVAGVVAVVVAEPPKLHALATEFCSL